MLVRDRERDRTAPGADVENAGSLESRDARKTALDHDLRLGPRDQDARVDLEREPPEPPLAEHVRQGLSGRTAPGEPRELSALVHRELPFRLERELGAREAENVADEELGVDLRRLATGSLQRLGRLCDRASDPHAEAAASAWRCSSARSASVSSPRSPSSTWSSRCSVTLIRWSVTRFSGKL